MYEVKLLNLHIMTKKRKTKRPKNPLRLGTYALSPIAPPKVDRNINTTSIKIISLMNCYQRG